MRGGLTGVVQSVGGDADLSSYVEATQRLLRLHPDRRDLICPHLDAYPGLETYLRSASSHAIPPQEGRGGDLLRQLAYFDVVGLYGAAGERAQASGLSLGFSWDLGRKALSLSLSGER